MGRAMRTWFLLAGLLSSTMAMAEVYKWVDQNGVTHYSNKPPVGVAAKKAGVIDERVSTYTPVAPVERARDSRADNVESTNAEKIDRLQRQLDAERRAREAGEEARKTAELEKQRQLEKCLAERRIDCGEPGASQRQVFVPVVVPRRNPPVTQPPFTPTSPITGVTAGNVTNTLSNNGASVDRTPGAFPAKK